MTELDPKKILEEMDALVSTHCVCGHSVHQHYPLHTFMTGCKIEDCDCLEFEGA